MRIKTYIIADTHFCHERVIRYENRPFANADEMDEKMIENWNRIVDEDDLVIHLGDVGIFNASQAESILPRLNGRKLLIRGNHDSFTKTKWEKLGFRMYERYFLDDYILTHKPVNETALSTAVSSGLLKGNIHGHTHSQNDHLDEDLYKCCSVEFIDYKPVLWSNFIREGEYRDGTNRL